MQVEQDTRETITEAADRLLARFGYRKMTMDDLAREVGIGKGSIYLHFASKKEVALSTVDRIVERVLANLEGQLGRPEPAPARLAAMLEDRVMLRFDAVRHYPEALGDLLADLRPELLERRKRYFRREARLLAGVIEEGVQAGVLLPLDAYDAARSLVTATNALLPFSLSAAELGRRSRMLQQVRDLAQILVRGLSRQAAPQGSPTP